jgi:tetratricopeptide (TPR) repeat protein
LRVDGSIYNIDNTDPLGFGCALNDEDFFECPTIGLVASVLNSRGIGQERLDNLKSAEEDYNAAVEVNPKYANAYNNLGNIKFKCGDYFGAIKDYSKAIQLNSAFVEAHCNRGIAKESVEDYSGALEDYDKAIVTNPDYVDAYCRRGVLRQIIQDYDGAAVDFDKVIELNPDFREKMMKLKGELGIKQ